MFFSLVKIISIDTKIDKTEAKGKILKIFKTLSNWSWTLKLLGNRGVVRITHSAVNPLSAKLMEYLNYVTLEWIRNNDNV